MVVEDLWGGGGLVGAQLTELGRDRAEPRSGWVRILSLVLFSSTFLPSLQQPILDQSLRVHQALGCPHGEK